MARKDDGYGANIIEDARRPGALYVRIYHDGIVYKRRAANLSHARELVHEIKRAIARGEWPPKAQPEAARFDELLADYREAKRREGKAIIRTDIGYRRLLERFGGRRADSLTPDEVECWRDAMLQTMAPATVNLHLCLLRAILRRAVRGKRLDPAALPEVKGPKLNNKRVRYLTDAEEAHLSEALPAWLRPLVTVAIHTGMRRGELLRLRWPEVDFVSGTIHVRIAKSGEGRHIPLSPTAHRTLAVLRDERRARLSARVVRHSDADRPVFAAPEGGFILNLNRAWYPALTRAGLEGFRFHDLRHTFASRLVQRGVSLYEVGTLLGHKTPAMTLRYAHLDPKALKAAVALLDAPGLKPWAERDAQS
jgi:integrase